jgi:hypothetical protein
MKHVRTVSRARVREAQGAVEALGALGSILTILSTLFGVLLPVIGKT